MTALCSGGPSAARTGFGASVAVGPFAIGALMNNWGTPWAVAAASYLGLVTYDLNQFCITDPPALPTLTGADYFNLVSFGDPAAHLLAVKKFEDWIGYRFWWDFCECTSVGTPAVPSPPARPVTWPTIDPIAAPVGAQQCHTFGVTSPQSPEGSAGGNTFDRILYGPEATSLVLTARHTLVGVGPHQDTFIELYWRNAGGTILSIQHQLIPPDGFDHTYTFGLPPTSADVICNVSYAATSTDTMNLYGYLVCGGNPGLPSDCCPPDPLLLAQVNSILEVVKLIQRQAAPFGYVYGANHTGVTGHGSFAASGLIGVSVDVTTVPAGASSEDGTPVQYFDLGYVTLGTADGYSTSRRIDHDGTLFIPGSAGLYTAIGYTLGAGVVADIRELVREP